MNKTKTACGLVWHQGWDDLHQMAQAYKDKYPNLFSTPYSSEAYSFIHSSAHRTKQSCEAFTEKLFGKKIMQESEKNWVTDDMMLRVSFYDFLSLLFFCSETHEYIFSYPKTNSHGVFVVILTHTYILLTVMFHKWLYLWSHVGTQM